MFVYRPFRFSLSIPKACSQATKTLFTTPYRSTSRNEFKRRFSHFLATFRATIGSVSQEQRFARKNSRWRRREQGVRAILRLRWTALKTNWCKNMRIYNKALKLARFIHIMLRKNVLNSRQLPEYFGILAEAWSYVALQKKLPLFISGKIYWLLPGI